MLKRLQNWYGQASITLIFLGEKWLVLIFTPFATMRPRWPLRYWHSKNLTHLDFTPDTCHEIEKKCWFHTLIQDNFLLIQGNFLLIRHSKYGGTFVYRGIILKNVAIVQWFELTWANVETMDGSEGRWRCSFDHFSSSSPPSIPSIPPPFSSVAFKSLAKL